MTGTFDGVVAMVTGASRGIGAATARRFADGGASVVLAARSADLLAEVAASIHGGARVMAVPTDVSDPDALDALVESTLARFGHVDVLVNNAGVLPTATRTERVSLEQWRAALDVNLTGPWYLACRVHESMAARGAGVVINVTSTASLYPSVGFSAYNASKAALTMLTKTLALEWARDGIRVLGIAPGKIETDLVRPILDYTASRGAALNPLGRVGLPEEVAELVAFLAGPSATYMTGSIITIDGGEVVATGADAAR